MLIIPITMWREARGLGESGMQAVYHVIHNRALNPQFSKDMDMEKVCLRAHQFSCWNSADPQRDKYPTEDDDAFMIAKEITEDPGKDPTNGALYYYDVSIQLPNWAIGKQQTARVGSLRFYK